MSQISSSFSALNIKYNLLETQVQDLINGGGLPTSSTLADVLTNGNSAGGNNINMNNQDIQSCDNIDVVTINGAAYPPAAPVVNNGTLQINNGTHITGSGTFTANQAGNTTITIATDATSSNVASTLVQRDAAGDFSAGTITASLSGNATSATSATSATTATNIAGGTASQIPYQSGASTTAFIANGTIGQVLTSNGTSAPSFATLPSAPVVNDGTLQINNGTHITGSGTFTANQAGNTTFTIATDATSSNVASTLVTRDGAGDFSAGTITASLSGNATSATTATNIAGGTASQIPYQSGASTTAFIANGTIGQVLTSNGTSAPSFATFSGSAGTLQQTLDLGNTATGANATIGLTNSGVGYTSNPQLTLNNSNATVGNTTGVPSVEYYKSGRNSAVADIIASHNFYAKNYAGTKTLFSKMEASVRNTAVGNDDGAIGMFATLNGVLSEFFRFNGADGENNSFYPIDMNNQAIKSSTGNLALSATSSTGNGDITLGAKRNVDLTAGTSGSVSLTAGTGGGAVNISGLAVNITSNGTAGDKTTLTSATSINLVPATDILTDKSITTLSVAGGNKIDFAGGTTDLLFDINKEKVRLHWNDAVSETATILLDNQYDTNSNISMIFTTATGDITTKIDNIATSQSVFLNDTRTGNVKSIILDNNPNSGENRMDLIQNSGGGIIAQSGIINNALTQFLSLSHTDNATANNKAVSLQQDTSGTGKLQYDNTIDTSAFEITSTNTDLKLSAPNTAGSGSNIEIAPAGQLVFTGSGLQSSSSTGSSGQYLVINLNGTTYKIPLDN